MAINKGIIQVRRGLKEDLQSDKLLPGELAIATDAPCMWFCWSPGNVEQLPTSDNVIDVIIETVNQYLANNDITVISDGFMRVYDGWIQYSADNKTWKNVIAVSELIGENGGYYTPAVTDNGDLTWTPSSAGMEPLPSVNIRGPEAELTKESVENALGYAPLKSADVVDNLLGNSGKLPLSDKQGKVLDEKISELNMNITYNGEYIFHPNFSKNYIYGTIRAYIPFHNADKYNITLVECLTGDSFSTNVTDSVDITPYNNEIGVFSQANHATLQGNMAYVKLNISPK